MVTKNIGARLSVKGGKEVITNLNDMGNTGDKAFKKIKRSSLGAGRQMNDFDRAAKRVNIHMGQAARKSGFASAMIGGIGVAAIGAVAGLGLLTFGYI